MPRRAAAQRCRYRQQQQSRRVVRAVTTGSPCSVLLSLSACLPVCVQSKHPPPQLLHNHSPPLHTHTPRTLSRNISLPCRSKSGKRDAIMDS
jgi:hypothetical protein